jgi:NAD-dependent dihydropyrimidine dehydrogenase PreA subunit
MDTLPVLGDFIRSVTHFCFVAEIVSCTGDFLDIENVVYTQWTIEDDSGTRIACIAAKKMNNKFAPKIETSKRYLFTNGAFCREIGVGIIADQMPVPLFYVITSETRIVPATPENCVGCARLSDLVDLALRCEFWGFIQGLTEIDTEYDPGNPCFRVLISDGPESRMQMAIAAEGIQVSQTVHPLCKIHEKLKFHGGELKMDHSPKSLRIQWNDQTIAEPIT